MPFVSQANLAAPAFAFPLEPHVISHSITIPSPDGTGEFALYVVGPAQKPRAALLVIHEIYGVNADIRRKCDLLAQQGYLAIAPGPLLAAGTGRGT